MTTINSTVPTGTDHHSGYNFIESGLAVEISQHKQMTCWGEFDLEGDLSIDGELIVEKPLEPSMQETDDHHSGFYAILSGISKTISENKQMTCWGDFLLDGSLIIDGELILEIPQDSPTEELNDHHSGFCLIQSGVSKMISENKQMTCWGIFDLDGSLIIDGQFIIEIPTESGSSSSSVVTKDFEVDAASEVPDTDLVCLLHMNGSGSDFEDYCGNTWASNGPTQVDTDKKFGSKSGLFNGISGNSSLLVPTLSLGTGEFTIDFWINLADYSSSYVIPWFGNQVLVPVFTGDRTLYVFHNGSQISASMVLIPNVWTHLAYVRESDGKVYLYKNGAKSSLLFTSSEELTIAEIGSADGGVNWMVQGYIDEFRAVKRALWTDDFTPPISEYSGMISIGRKEFQVNTPFNSLSDIDVFYAGRLLREPSQVTRNILNNSINIVNDTAIGEWIRFRKYS